MWSAPSPPPPPLPFPLSTTSIPLLPLTCILQVFFYISYNNTCHWGRSCASHVCGPACRLDQLQHIKHMSTSQASCMHCWTNLGLTLPLLNQCWNNLGLTLSWFHQCWNNIGLTLSWLNQCWNNIGLTLSYLTSVGPLAEHCHYSTNVGTTLAEHCHYSTSVGTTLA